MYLPLLIGGIVLAIVGLICILVAFLYVGKKKDMGQKGWVGLKADKKTKADPRAAAIEKANLTTDQKKWKNIHLGLLIGGGVLMVLGLGLGAWGGIKKKKTKP
jgi:hypothetical protein